LECPNESYNKYQNDMMTKYSDVVAVVTQAGIDKLKSLQSQHQVLVRVSIMYWLESASGTG